ncbi:MAG: hypothetical protein DRN30_04120 [Thermoplasmata archaeon]|nr:MAG: hypothetical protein DRN30_04120 [Thermoplasmata archaeon]
MPKMMTKKPNEPMYVEDISLEDLAMGVMPKKNAQGEKTEPVSAEVTAELKKMAAMVKKAESKSVASFKKYNKTELSMLIKGYNEVQDNLYRVKEMARDARKGKTGGKRSNMMASIGCDY